VREQSAILTSYYDTPLPIPIQVPHTLFDKISLGVDAVRPGHMYDNSHLCTQQNAIG